jgi:hypothetical protein
MAIGLVMLVPTAAGAEPLTARTAQFRTYNETYLAADGSEHSILGRMLTTGFASSIVYTFIPGLPALSKAYRLGNENVVRRHGSVQIRWVAKRHEEFGQKLAPPLREMAAVQLCIWSFDDGGYLTPQRVPDEELRTRAAYLREEADRHASEQPQNVFRQVELSVDVVRSTAKRVELDVWLRDTDSGSALDGHEVTLTYDGASEVLTTNDGGHVLAQRDRLDRKVTAEASWQAHYSQGVLWVADDSSQPELIQAERLQTKLRTAVAVDPDSLKSGTDLMYQEIGDFVDRHTPLGAQPAALIGLIALGAGWVIVALQFVYQLRRRD